MKQKGWDFSFYRNKYHLNEKAEKLDDKTIKQYFQLEHVKQETMKIYEQFLGLKFRKIET